MPSDLAIAGHLAAILESGADQAENLALTIRLPRVVLPVLRGGKDGWFEIKNLAVGDTTIQGSAAINFVNKPKIHIDRRTGTISIYGMNGTYVGRCQKAEAGTVF